MAFTGKSDRSLLASLGIAFFVLTGIFAILAINFRSKETTELRSRANLDQHPYNTITPKVTPSVDACTFAYRGHCYEDQSAVDMARSNYERSLKVACYLPANIFCPPAVEQPTPISDCPHQYDGRCYATEDDAQAAEQNDDNDPNTPAVDQPVPIDQN